MKKFFRRSLPDPKTLGNSSLDQKTMTETERKPSSDESKVDTPTKNTEENIIEDGPKNDLRSNKPTETRRKKTQLDALKSNLSPKYIALGEETGGKRSRYGRQQKYREAADYLPTEITAYVRRTPPKLKSLTPPASAGPKVNPYVSPIEKLIHKNKLLATQTDNDENASLKDVESSEKEDIPSLILEKEIQEIVITSSAQKTKTDKQSETKTGMKTGTKVKNKAGHKMFGSVVKLKTQKMSELISKNEVINQTSETSEKETLAVASVHTASSTIPSFEDNMKTSEMETTVATIHIAPSTIPSFEDNMKTSEMETTVATIHTAPSTIPSFEDNMKTSDMETLEKSPSSTESSTLDVATTASASLNITPSYESNMEMLQKSPLTISSDSAKGSSIDMEMDFTVTTGEIYWGQISKYPYWPCIVWPDPDGRTIAADGNKAMKQPIKIHVRFFADNGRRSWVKRMSIIPFVDRAEFDKLAQEKFTKYSKKSPISKNFIVPRAQQQVWERAVDEATSVAKLAIDLRCGEFEKFVNEAKTVEKEKRKRRQSVHMNWKTPSYTEDSDNFSLDSMFPAKKRNRSPTPESPAYEKIPAYEEIEADPITSSKRRKLDASPTSAEVTPFVKVDNPSILSTSIEDFFETREYRRFVSQMKQIVLPEPEKIVEGYIDINLRQLWLYKYISEQKMSQPDMKKLLNANDMSVRRLKAALHRRSLPADIKVAAPVVKREKISKIITVPIDEVVENILNLPKNYLFRNLSREPVCKTCRKPSNLFQCTGGCLDWFHKDCTGTATVTVTNQAISGVKVEVDGHITGDSDDVKITIVSVLCSQCVDKVDVKCFVCNRNDTELGERFKCCMNKCGKFYHIGCLKYWPQANITESSLKIESLLCPRHVCQTCVSDDPRGKFLQTERSKMISCIDCPATYHMDSFCIPAGAIFLTANQIICPRHEPQTEKMLNANWCFICVNGGSLICCETCPMAFHLECLKIQQPNEYICEECETGRLPLYGELVWAKFGSYRWWPGIIIPPSEVPDNVNQLTHNPHDFCVRFFGSNDHGWISRRRVFLYQEGDWGKANSIGKVLDVRYMKGVKEAKRLSELIKEKQSTQNHAQRQKGLMPMPYVKIKTNRPVPPVKMQEFVDISNLSACECDPAVESPCGPNSGCLNRLLLTECHPKVCRAETNCQNQMFEKRIYPSLKLTQTNSKGWGLTCEHDMEAGTFVIEYVGEIIDDNEFKRRIAKKQENKEDHYYFLTLEKDLLIDAGPKGNLARFMNHSCEPNCETQKWTVNGSTRVGLFAVQNIPANTELTFNYNLECTGNEKKICHCGAQKCAGFIGAKYKKPEKTDTAVPKKKIKQKNKNRTKNGAKARRASTQ